MSPFPSYRSILLPSLVTSLALTTACDMQADPNGAPESSSEASRGAGASTAAHQNLERIPNGPPSYTYQPWNFTGAISVCFTTATSALYRSIVQSVFEEEFTAKLGIHFQGFNTCTMPDGTPVADFLVGGNAAIPPGMTTCGVPSSNYFCIDASALPPHTGSVTFSAASAVNARAGAGSWATWYDWTQNWGLNAMPNARLRWLRRDIAHEFSHTLGLDHENARADHPTFYITYPSDGVAPDGSGNVRYRGIFDAFSITNYAALPDSHRHSDGDKAGLQDLCPGCSMYNLDPDSVVGTGDFDGDGTDEFVVITNEGLGIVGLQGGKQWTAKAFAKFGTANGGWTFGPSDNVVAVGRFTKSNRASIALKSSQGVGIAEIGAGGSLQVTRFAKFGTGLPGGWTLNKFDTVGLAVPGGSADTDYLVVRSPWGMGVLSFANSVTVAFTWSYGHAVNGAFDMQATDLVLGVLRSGNSRASLLVEKSSGTGKGLYRVNMNAGRTYDSFTKADATGALKIGGWYWSWDDRVVGIGDFNGDGVSDFLLRNRNWGMCAISGATRAVMAAGQYGTSLNGWQFAGDHLTTSVGRYDGKKDGFLVRSGWGIGVLSVDAATGTFKPLAVASWKTSLPGDVTHTTQAWTIRPDDNFTSLVPGLHGGKAGVLVRHANSTTNYGDIWETPTSLTLLTANAAGGFVNASPILDDPAPPTHWNQWKGGTVLPGAAGLTYSYQASIQLARGNGWQHDPAGRGQHCDSVVVCQPNAGLTCVGGICQ